MTSISTFIATRIRQPWRAILSVLNRSLIGKDTSWDTTRLLIPQILWGIVHSANLDFASLIWDEFGWQIVDRSTKQTKMSKLFYTRFTKLIIAYFLSCNKNIPRRSNSKMHSKGDDLPITKLSNTVEVESEKVKVVEEPEEQNVSPVRSGRGKAELAKFVSIKEPHTQQRRMSQLTIDSQIDEDVVHTYAEWGHKLKGPAVDDPAVQSLLDLRKRSKSSRLEKTDSDTILYYSCSYTLEESANETDDADESDMDLTDDNLDGDDVLQEFIQTLLDETPTNELTNFMSHLVYTDAQTTSVVHNPEGNPELTSYISGASEVPFGTYVDVLATKTLLKEAHAKGKKNMRKINFKKAVAQKFRDYDQKLEALTNFNVFEAFEKVVQERVLTKIKKLLPTHIPKAVANYVRPRLNTSVLEKSYYTLYDSILLDQEALDAQEAEPSFLKRSHDHHDSPNNCKGEKKKKRRKDAGQSSTQTSRKDKAPMVTKQTFLSNNTPIHDGLPRSRGLEKLKLHYKNDVELDYHVHQLKAAVVSEAQWNSDEGDVSKPRSFERHMSKSSKPHPSFYNNDFYYLVYFSTEEKYTTSLTKHYAARYHIQGYGFLSSIVVRISDKQEYTFSYADLPRLSLNDIEDMYLLKVQDKTHHLHSEDERDFNNALLLFIQRTVIKNKVEDLQLGVESYQRTINLTKPKLYFEGIDENIPYTMTRTEKGVVYLNKYNRRSMMKLNEVHKFCDGTLTKIQENLIDMLNKNKLGQSNERFKGRDRNDKDVKRSKEMVDKIDQVMKRIEQLRRLEEYVGGRLKIINPRVFVRPM
ncbi:hypothetical protein Tco_1142026 [Tanacetum coccineum]